MAGPLMTCAVEPTAGRQYYHNLRLTISKTIADCISGLTRGKHDRINMRRAIGAATDGRVNDPHQ